MVFWLHLGLLVLLVLAAPARGAQAQLSASIGWGGIHRIGEWTPLYVTVASPTATGQSPTPQRATLEVWAYQDARYTVVHRAPVPLNPAPSTFLMPVLMGSLIEGHSVVLRAEPGGDVLASLPLGRLSATNLQNITTATRLVGLSGQPTGGVMPGDFVGGYLPLSRLPEHPELYETLDLLTLSGDPLESLSPGQSAAIVAWVKAGGRLLVCLPPEGIFAPPELSEILPATVGDLASFASGLAGRELIPKPGSQPIPTGSPIPGYQHRVGFGWVGILATPLTPESRSSAAALVGPLRPRVMLEPPSFAPPTSPAWKGFALPLIVLGLLLGPVEAVIRRAHDVWPWWWWSVAGVGMLLVGTALWLVPAETDTTTTEFVTLTDQSQGEVVAHAIAGPAGSGFFPRPLVSTSIRGTDHKTADIVLADSKPVLHRSPVAIRELSQLPLSNAAKREVRLESGTLQITSPPNLQPDEVLLESAAGIQTAQRSPDGRWTLQPDAQSTLPTPFAAARRLAPLRSAALQPQINSGEVRLLWLRTGTTFHRILLPPP
jgi:hypothetical protein